MLQELLDKVRDLSQSLQPAGGFDLSQLMALREIFGGPIDSRLWREGNESVHHPDVLRRMDAFLHKSGAFSKAAEANRAFEEGYAWAMTGPTAATVKPDETEDERKSPEEPKPVNPAKPADPSRSPKKRS
jgi:hypothetical protein